MMKIIVRQVSDFFAGLSSSEFVEGVLNRQSYPARIASAEPRIDRRCRPDVGIGLKPYLHSPR